MNNFGHAMSIPAIGVERCLWLTVAVKELSTIYAARARVNTDHCFAKISFFYKFSDRRNFYLKHKRAHKHTKTFAVFCAHAPIAALIRRGDFAGFVVMLGGVKTKDVLSLT